MSASLRRQAGRKLPIHIWNVRSGERPSAAEERDGQRTWCVASEPSRHADLPVIADVGVALSAIAVAAALAANVAVARHALAEARSIPLRAGVVAIVLVV